jgi:transposase
VIEIAQAQQPPGLAAEATKCIAKLYAIDYRIKAHPPDVKIKMRY